MKVAEQLTVVGIEIAFQCLHYDQHYRHAVLVYGKSIFSPFLIAHTQVNRGTTSIGSNTCIPTLARNGRTNEVLVASLYKYYLEFDNTLAQDLDFDL